MYFTYYINEIQNSTGKDKNNRKSKKLFTNFFFKCIANYVTPTIIALLLILQYGHHISHIKKKKNYIKTLLT